MFDVTQDAFEDGEWSDELAANYRRGLFEAFEKSPEGTACQEHLGELGWTYTFLDLALNYVGTTPPGMSLADLNEVLLEIFPRKVSTEPESAEAIVCELRAFWEFLGRQYQLPNAPKFVAALDARLQSRLERELANPQNFGMAKSLFMMGDEMGFDMTTQEGLNEFMIFYNSSLVGTRPPASDSSPARAWSQSAEPLHERMPTPIMPERTPMTASDRKAMNKARQKRLQAIKRRR